MTPVLMKKHALGIKMCQQSSPFRQLDRVHPRVKSANKTRTQPMFRDHLLLPTVLQGSLMLSCFAKQCCPSKCPFARSDTQHRLSLPMYSESAYVQNV